jgi:hypothetical protein
VLDEPSLAFGERVELSRTATLGPSASVLPRDTDGDEPTHGFVPRPFDPKKRPHLGLVSRRRRRRFGGAVTWKDRPLGRARTA